MLAVSGYEPEPERPTVLWQRRGGGGGHCPAETATWQGDGTRTGWTISLQLDFLQEQLHK